MGHLKYINNWSIRIELWIEIKIVKIMKIYKNHYHIFNLFYQDNKVTK